MAVFLRRPQHRECSNGDHLLTYCTQCPHCSFVRRSYTLWQRDFAPHCKGPPCVAPLDAAIPPMAQRCISTAWKVTTAHCSCSHVGSLAPIHELAIPFTTNPEGAQQRSISSTRKSGAFHCLPWFKPYTIYFYFISYVHVTVHDFHGRSARMRAQIKRTCLSPGPSLPNGLEVSKWSPEGCSGCFHSLLVARLRHWRLFTGFVFKLLLWCKACVILALIALHAIKTVSDYL